jgi:hypothetical protein
MARSTPRARTTRRKQKSPPFWIQFWPLLLGIVITPFAVRGASVLALNGPSALRMLYPYVVLAQGHSEHFASSQEEIISQWVMYGQFPLYGIVWMLAQRMARAAGGPLSVLLLHCLGVGAAIFTAPNN